MRRRPSFPAPRHDIDTRMRESRQALRPVPFRLRALLLILVRKNPGKPLVGCASLHPPTTCYGAFAQWTIANIPAARRQALSDRVRQQAAQTTDAAERDGLLAFADAIKP